MIKHLSLFLLVLSVLASPALGLGISPARVEFPYEPGAVYNLTLTVIDNDKTPMNITFVKEGELAPYIEFENKTVHLEIGQSTTLPVKFTVPGGLKPGMHQGMVGPLQLPESIVGISAVVSVLAQIRTRVPYPDKYAEVELETQDIELSEDELFTATLHNYGSINIENAQGYVQVYDNGSEIARVDLTPLRNVAPSSADRMYAKWKPSKAGAYSAKAFVNYDGLDAVSAERAFRVGDILIEILGVSPKTLIAGSLNLLSIDAQSSWNEPLEGFASVKLFQGKSAVAEGSGPTEKFGPWERKNLDVYLDLKDVPEGMYPASVTVRYAGRESNITTEFEVTAQVHKVKVSGTELLLVILLLIVIGLMLYYIKKKKNE